MSYFNVNSEIARLILLQRIETSSSFQKKLRKLFGRYLFTNFFSRYFISHQNISKKYFDVMKKEYDDLSKYIETNNKYFLSIGAGMCGLEILINNISKNNFFTIIEKNYVSKKVTYGWDDKNKEAYNNLNLLNLFLKKNGFKSNYEIFDYDKDLLPIKKYDFIISLYSLDYHYDFSFYQDYLRKVSEKETRIIFDTIRSDYFKKIFKDVRVISSNTNTVHNSKRIICSNFREN